MKNIYFILLFLILFSCSTKSKIDSSNEKKELVSNASLDINKDEKNPSDPFYPLKESIHDLQNQITDLKSQVIEYESRLHNPSIDTELIKLIKSPDLKNEIIMNTGTVIQGTIISENSTQMVVKTQIGQLTIEKEFVVEIKDIEPLTPNLQFEDIIEERQSDSLHTYIGKVKNIGGRRADFVRVIYYYWADDTSPIIRDSVFVSSNSTVYLNGVISDASIEPTELGDFKLSTVIPDTVDIEYITKEIKWNIFE